MFTIEQIEEAHSKVKTGADFPSYIKEIKSFGVIRFETWVTDSHTEYFGSSNFSINSSPKYDQLRIVEESQKDKFIHKLKEHQQGKTDYFKFCQDCSDTGIEKWIVNLEDMTCTYYDKKGTKVVIEQIPN